jgi:non-specific serine/threonine protein kinase
MRLFVERASTALPGFQVTQDNIVPLTQICQRLDGIPLALELAAVRMKILTTAQIAERLADRYHLLTDGSRTDLPRHQTLRALVDWSWELLSSAEQNLLQRLSVFAGGMSLEAVEAVCAGDGIVAHDLLDLLTALVNKSLIIVQRKQGQETRYRLLETIRQYAHERLVPAGQETVFRSHHLAYFLLLAEQAEQKLIGPEQAAWLNQLERDLDNVRAALAWAGETDVETGLRITIALWQFWDHGYVREGATWLAQLLALAKSVTPAIKAKALWMYGRLNYYLLDSDLAEELVEESIVLNRELGNLHGIALGFLMQGVMAIDSVIREKHLLESQRLFQATGDKRWEAETLQHLGYSEVNHKQAMRYLQESESIYRELGHLAGVASVIIISGRVVILHGDFDFEAMRLRLEEGLAIEESLGRRGSSATLQLMGMMYFRGGKYQQALEHLEKSISISQRTGDKMYNYWSFVHSGYVLLRLGEFAQSRDVFIKSVMQFKETNIISGVVFSMEGLASLATQLGQFDRAVQLFAWTDATRETTRDRRPRVEQADVDRDMAVLRQKMGENAVAAAYGAGKAMTMEQALACAMDIDVVFIAE